MVVDPASQQMMVTDITWAPMHAASDLATAVARCQAASADGEATTVLTLHVTSGPAAALAARFDAVSTQMGLAGGIAADGQQRRGQAGGAARSGVTTSKLTFVCVAAASAEEATATTAGRRGLSNLRSRVMGDRAAPSGGRHKLGRLGAVSACLTLVEAKIGVELDPSQRLALHSEFRSETSNETRQPARRRVRRKSRMGRVGGRGRSAAQRWRAVRAVPPVQADAIFTGHAARRRCAKASIFACRSRTALHCDCSINLYHNSRKRLYTSPAGAVSVLVCVDPSEHQRSASESTLSYAAQMLGAKPARTA